MNPLLKEKQQWVIFLITTCAKKIKLCHFLLPAIKYGK
jgi:hypothetical protein